MREPVSGEAVDDSVGITKLVVKERTDNTGRQCVTDIANALTHVIPNVGHLFRPGRLLQSNEDSRESRTGVAANKIRFCKSGVRRDIKGLLVLVSSTESCVRGSIASIGAAIAFRVNAAQITAH